MNSGPILYDQAMELPLDIVYSRHSETAAQHILAYFRQEFSKPSRAPKPVSHEEQILLNQIASAFDGVILEDGIGLMTAELMDMHASREVCDAVVPHEERTGWRRIPPRHDSCMLELSGFYGSEGVPLPPAGMADSGPPRAACPWDAMDNLPLIPENCGVYESKAILLNDPQLEAVINFIKYRQKTDS